MHQKVWDDVSQVIVGRWEEEKEEEEEGYFLVFPTTTITTQALKDIVFSSLRDSLRIESIVA
jgi:hypothetical protein